ncbi:hypothetical protein Tco_0800473 [Tanacetum coccineum]|uniref:Integrase, catalytic region, zinc finger, CCHC-type, peptidase aspartic, catalytic n=1 Tax=Tanacetum coccineum TaxID=301880 RepID=A0ABQ4ZWZ2_9ASTR
MLKKSIYDSWASRIRLFINGKKNDDYDVQATNIILHGLSADVYALVNHQEVAKDIWDRGETLYEYYWRFSQLINDMHTIGMKMQQVQVNTKFLNALLPEWSKFVTDINLTRVCIPPTMISCMHTLVNMNDMLMKYVSCVKDIRILLHCALSQRGQEILHGLREVVVVEAQKAGQILDSEQLAFIADPGIEEALVAQQTIPQNLAFQTEHLDAYDSDCDVISWAKAVLMANLSSYNSDVLSESHTPVRIEAPSELPKVSLVNESLKKLKYHLASFDKVVKKRTTSNAISADKNAFEIQIKQLSIDNDQRIDNDQLLNQIIFQEIVHIAVNSVDILNMNKSCMDECNKCLELEAKLLKKKDFIKKDVYDKLVKSYSKLEKHYISLELAIQLNQEIFQKDNFRENKNAPTFNQLFEINELKAQSQEKDTVIRKLKDRIKSLSGKDSVENVKKDIDEIETINIELEHSVAKLLSENENLRKEREHLKSIYKDQFDSIRKTRVQSKEHCDSLIAQINAKSVENSDLNAQLQEKVFAIAALKNELRKLKGKNVVDTAVSKPSATIAPGMFKLDIEPISHRLKNNRDAHEVYLEKTIENTDTLHGLTCPSLTKPYEILVAVTPINKDKKVRFVKPVTSSSNIPKQTDSLKTKDSNKPLLTSTGVNTTTSASGSKLTSNTKKNRISRLPSSNQNNKVEEHPRKFESICAICNKCLFDANHDMCLINYVNDVNVHSKSKSERNKIRKLRKPTGKVFTEIGYSWKPTGRIFTIVGNRCPLNRITSTKEVPFNESTITPVITPSPELKVYSRKPKASRSVGSSSKVKIVESNTSNTKEPKKSWGSTVSDVPFSSLIDCRLSKLFCSIALRML